MAQEALYQKFFDNAYRTCNRYLSQHDDVMGVVNEGFLKVFQNLSRYDRQLGLADTWIHRIMVNTAIDHIRKERRSPVLNEWSDETITIAVNNDALSALAAEEILQLVKNLPPVTRTVFNFAIVEGYVHKEIAEALGISEGTSRWHLSEAKKRLQQMMCDKEKTNKLHEEKTYT